MYNKIIIFRTPNLQKDRYPIMNNTVSLPRLRSNSEFSKPMFSMERKKSVNLKKIETIKEDKL